MVGGLADGIDAVMTGRAGSRNDVGVIEGGWLPCACAMAGVTTQIGDDMIRRLAL